MNIAQNVLDDFYVKFETESSGVKTRSPGQIKGKSGHIFEAIIMNLLKMFVLMGSRSDSKLCHLRS